MENQSTQHLINTANRVYDKISVKMKQISANKRLCSALEEIKLSLDELNKLASEVDEQEHSEIKQIADFIKQEQILQCNAEIENCFDFLEKSENVSSVRDKENLDVKREGQSSKQRQSRGPYRQYSSQMKQNVIKLYREGINYTKISRTLGIPSKNVVRWCKNGVDRKPGAGRKVLDPKMEQSLNSWIVKNFSPRSKISIEQIRKQAKSLSSHCQFSASLGWFKNFCKRFKIKEKYVIS